MTRGLVHHYFGSKRTLFLEAMRSSVLMPETELPDLSALPLEERVRACMDWILEAATTYGELSLLARKLARSCSSSLARISISRSLACNSRFIVA